MDTTTNPRRTPTLLAAVALAIATGCGGESTQAPTDEVGTSTPTSGILPGISDEPITAQPPKELDLILHPAAANLGRTLNGGAISRPPTVWLTVAPPGPNPNPMREPTR